MTVAVQELSTRAVEVAMRIASVSLLYTETFFGVETIFTQQFHKQLLRNGK